MMELGCIIFFMVLYFAYLGHTFRKAADEYRNDIDGIYDLLEDIQCQTLKIEDRLKEGKK
ncbi:MAG: hypothetical protein MJ170_02845 [Alphaproteobacteria bacterium]|nr:hypothetical protein [Alphaproteobacteria bacterium]